jgi:hypothetical protein
LLIRPSPPFWPASKASQAAFAPLPLHAPWPSPLRSHARGRAHAAPAGPAHLLPALGSRRRPASVLWPTVAEAMRRVAVRRRHTSARTRCPRLMTCSSTPHSPSTLLRATRSHLLLSLWKATAGAPRRRSPSQPRWCLEPLVDHLHPILRSPWRREAITPLPVLRGDRSRCRHRATLPLLAGVRRCHCKDASPPPSLPPMHLPHRGEAVCAARPTGDLATSEKTGGGAPPLCLSS